jgi:hypothetical protein
MKKRIRKKYDWVQIRHEYVTSLDGSGEITLEALSRKHGCSERHIRRLSAREGWPKLRAEWRAKTMARARAEASETAAQRLMRHAKTMQVIQAKGIKAIQDENTMPSARDIIEAAKTERLIFGEADSRSEIISSTVSSLTSEQRIEIYKLLGVKSDENDRTKDKK